MTKKMTKKRLNASVLRKGIYPGSFDPITKGHMDIILRALKLVDHLTIGIASRGKLGSDCLFAPAERVEMVSSELADCKDKGIIPLSADIEIHVFDALLVDFARSNNIDIIIRGIRAFSDFEYEFNMALANRRLNQGIETIFLTASENNQFVSSRLAREISSYSGSARHFVSPAIEERLAKRLVSRDKENKQRDFFTAIGGKK